MDRHLQIKLKDRSKMSPPASHTQAQQHCRRVYFTYFMNVHTHTYIRWQMTNNLFYCQLTATINFAIGNKLYELFIQ